MVQQKNILKGGILAILALLSLTACGDKNDGPNNELDSDWIDPVFAEELQKRGYIKDAKTVKPSDVEKITSLDVSGIDYSNRGPLTSVKGIEYFVNLVSLNCSSNHISELNISNLTKLKVLKCVENDLYELNLKPLTQLQELLCYTNFIGELDLSTLSDLKVLDCSNNRFNTLDVRNLKKLTHLTCSYLNLTELDVTQNVMMEDLRCHANSLKSLDLSNMQKLVLIDIRWNSGENGKFVIYVGKNINIDHIPFAVCDPSWTHSNGEKIEVVFEKR